MSEVSDISWQLKTRNVKKSSSQGILKILSRQLPSLKEDAPTKLTLAQIMHVSGHKTQKDIMDYNKLSSEEIADELMLSTPKNRINVTFLE